MEEKENVKELKLLDFSAVSKSKSVKRAWRRGHISILGAIYPRRPFNNRTTKENSRPFNELKKNIYGQLKNRRRLTA